MSSHSEKAGHATRAKGVSDVASQSKSSKASRLALAHSSTENDVLLAQAQVIEPSASVTPQESPPNEQAGSVVYIEVPSQFEPSKTGENVFAPTHQGSGVWDFSLADIDPGLYGFLGVVVAGTLSFREANKQSVAPNNASAKNASQGVALGDTPVLLETSTAIDWKAVAKDANTSNDVSPIRIDLTNRHVELGSTMEVTDGSKSIGKVVLQQTDLDNNFVDVKPITEPGSRQNLQVLVIKAGASVPFDTFWVNAQADASSSEGQHNTATHVLAAAWGNDASTHATGAALHLDSVI